MFSLRVFEMMTGMIRYDKLIYEKRKKYAQAMKYTLFT